MPRQHCQVEMVDWHQAGYLNRAAMNISAQEPTSATSERQSESNLLDVFDVFGDSKWLISATVLLGITAALVYVAVVPPTYEAATLIQIEESRSQGSSASSAYLDTSGLLESRSPAVAEISVLRSGVVLGEVIERLGLDVSARPRYAPVIGRWLGSRATEPSDPGVSKLRAAAGYVYGNESIQIGKFVVPRGAEGKPFSLVLTPGGYELHLAGGGLAATGQIGIPAKFSTAGGEAEILVTAAVGRPGAAFRIKRLTRSEVLEKLQRSLKVEEQGKQSGMLRVRFAGDSPEAAANIVNEIAKSYLRQNTQRRAADAEKALFLVESTLPNLRGQIVQAEEKLARVRNHNAAAELTARGKLELEQSSRLETRLIELQSKRNQLSADLLPGHPNMRALEMQIAAATADLGSINKRIKVLPPVEQETLELSREMKVKAELYAGLLNGSQQIRLAKEGRAGNIRIVDPAWPPAEPLGPHPSALLAAGATGGLVLGMLLALFRRSVRRGVQDPDLIEWRSALSVLTTVPYSKAQKSLARSSKGALRNSRVLAVRAPQDPAVESLRSMRAVLERKVPGGGSTIVVVTGPTHGIGKSFTSTNLAAVLGASGRHVLLIDADLRKGHLHDAFNLAPGHGLSDIIAGKCTRPEVLHRNVVPDVDFIAAGRPCATPADLLGTKAAELFLRECSARYDYVIVDTPPVLAASDAAILAQHAGVVFLIARAEVTTLRELDESEKRLSQRGVEVHGVIYTGVDASKRRNSVYSYGGYDYLPNS